MFKKKIKSYYLYTLEIIYMNYAYVPHGTFINSKYLLLFLIIPNCGINKFACIITDN